MENVTKGKIKRKNNIFVRWWRLAEPHKGLFFADLFFYGLYAILLSVFTIFAAKTINCMYAGDWKGAFINLGIELATIVLRNIFIHITYILYAKQNKHIRLGVANKIYNKVISCKTQDIDNMSIEKITNIATNNMSYLSDFQEEVIIVFGKLMQIIFTLVVVFMYSPLAGAIVLGLGIINFIAYYLFNKKMGRIMLDRYEKKDDMFKSYSKIIDGKNVIKELKAEERYKTELTENVNKFANAYGKYYVVYSIKNDIWYAVWNCIVYAITAVLLYTVSKGSLDIAVYLVIVPYLKSCTESLNAVFDKTNSIENMRVDVDRVNLILQLSDEELIQYGNLNKEVEEYNLGLIGVSEYKKAGQKYSLENVNISFLTGKTNVIKGPKGDGKRVIFDILRRYNAPDKGTAVLDNLNLYDYNESTFKNHINYCASHPNFIKGTIKENLTIANKDFTTIENLCAELGILNEIQSMSKGFDTDIKEVKSNMTLFMLGLVRALLSNCKILMIYELPQDVTEDARKNVVNLVRKYHIDKTLILFTHTDSYDEVADRIYSVVQGTVEKVK